MKSRTVEEDVVSLGNGKENLLREDLETGRNNLGKVKKILVGSVNHGPTWGSEL